MAEVHPSVDAEQRDRLRSLLIQYGDILSINEMDMGLTDMIQHEIDTGEEKPVRQQLRRTPYGPSTNRRRTRPSHVEAGDN